MSKYVFNENHEKFNVIDIVYPVGSIFLSVNDDDPSTLFGGTWERLKDRFLLGAGDSYSAGNTGGSATHSLTVDEIPKHSHGYVKSYDGYANYEDITNVNVKATQIYSSEQQTSTTGGGKAHNNMPPYLVVHMWKRTA